MKIATPPSIAVGFLCQRSVFGRATTPQRRANARTIGVRISASANDATTGRRSESLSDISWRNREPFVCREPTEKLIHQTRQSKRRENAKLKFRQGSYLIRLLRFHHIFEAHHALSHPAAIKIGNGLDHCRQHLVRQFG